MVEFSKIWNLRLPSYLAQKSSDNLYIYMATIGTVPCGTGMHALLAQEQFSSVPV